ncbi:MAG: long-chain fatty acid--CoA ligase [Acidimicrobiales bacterium]|nr:long-chain fatty acid--CoA ligase [Acidimicrobiales bacterium]
MAFETILHRLDNRASSNPNGVAYRDKVTGSWRETTWAEYNELVGKTSKALMKMGVGDGDVVSILGNNRPEWTLMLLGAMGVGGVGAGIYASNSPEEVSYIVNHSESKVIIVEDMGQYEKVKAEWHKTPSLANVVMMEGAEQPDDDRVLSWEDFLASGADIDDDVITSARDALRADQNGSFIYTSGTTGPPKAVMLTHENLSWTADMLANAADIQAGDEVLSYLPLSHIAEQDNSVHIAITVGSVVNYCHEGLKVADYLQEVRPMVFFGVPRVWERFYAGVGARMAEAEGAKAKIASWARGVGSKATAERNAGGEPGGLLAVQEKIADKLVFSKLREALGLDRCKIFISGAAPASVEILEFMGSLGITICEIYGQSEGTGPTSSNLPGAVKFGSVGKPLPGIEVKLGPDDEIIFRGKNVFPGCFKDQAATDECLEDGWLHSGDLGSIDEDGYLWITGRKKDIIITSGGKNIAPKNIEGALTSLELVGHAVCIGEQQRYLTALITLEPEAAKRFAEANNEDVSNLHTSEALRAHFEAEIAAKVNNQFARVEHVRNFRILPHEFTVESGELTPTFKIKRAVVNEMYSAEIAKVYDMGQAI